MEKKFIAEGGIEVTDELLDEWAKPWEEGEVPGTAVGFVARPGRPRIFDEPTKVVSLRLPASVVDAIEEKARKRGETRTQRMRDVLIADALCA